MKLAQSVLISALSLSALVLVAADNKNMQKLDYPKPPKGDVVDDYFGTKVADPYRWMEDLDSPEVKQWVDAENKITFAYLEQIPQRESIKRRMTELFDFEKYTVPEKHGSRYFYQHNTGLQNQNVLYWLDSLNGTPKVLLDPNTLSKDGTVAVNGMSVTDDGKYAAIAIAAAGSDWTEIHVRDVAGDKELPDVIRWTKFSGAAWLKDDSGFFYAGYDAPSGKEMRDETVGQKLKFHKLGTAQEQDALVYQPEDKNVYIGGNVSDDGRYLFITLTKGGSKNKLYFKDLSAAGSQIVKLIDADDALYQPIGNDGGTFYVMTTKDASRGKIVAIDAAHPQSAAWKTVIAEGPKSERLDLESGGGMFGDLFALTYLKDAHSEVRLYDLSGKLVKNVPLPGIGSVHGLSGLRSDTETFFGYASFNTPLTIYHLDLKAKQATMFRAPKLKFDATQYTTEQVFYASKDGTKITMFITYKKGMVKNGQNPTLLYGYGGFDISLTPAFSASVLTWLEMGGVYAEPNLRGGGEYGEEWHQAGMRQNKQNVFDDFIAAAEWLIANRYTSTPKLAISGGSNGGLLVGACETQRPDLFGAALPAVGVMDMLRFDKFTVGWGWRPDYGSPSENKADFETNFKFSPLHNIKPGTSYPPTLITTADHDDRVVPAHSFKFAATMQEAQAGGNPILIRIETRAGHGAGKPVTKQIEEAADRWAFLVRNLGM